VKRALTLGIGVVMIGLVLVLGLVVGKVRGGRDLDEGVFIVDTLRELIAFDLHEELHVEDEGFVGFLDHQFLWDGQLQLVQCAPVHVLECRGSWDVLKVIKHCSPWVLFVQLEVFPNKPL